MGTGTIDREIVDEETGIMVGVTGTGTGIDRGETMALETIENHMMSENGIESARGTGRGIETARGMQTVEDLLGAQRHLVRRVPGLQKIVQGLVRGHSHHQPWINPNPILRLPGCWLRLLIL